VGRRKWENIEKLKEAKIEYIFVLFNHHNTKTKMNQLLNLVVGERYLFRTSKNSNFVATYVKHLNNTLILTKYSDENSRMCGDVYSYTANDILNAFPLSELVAGQKYRFWYLEKINNENNINVPVAAEYYHKSHEGIFLELTDLRETLIIDTRENPEHLRMGILSTPLIKYVKFEKL